MFRVKARLLSLLITITFYIQFTLTLLQPLFFAVALGAIHNIFTHNRFASTRIIALLGRLLATEVFVSRRY
jgi:hypothetical protein